MALIFNGAPILGTIADDFILDFEGDGSSTLINGDDGDDYIQGDSANFFTAGAAGFTAGSGSILTLTTTAWSLTEHPDIANSTTIPHATVYGDAVAGQTAWYRVDVIAGQTITIDLDYGSDLIGAAFDGELQLFDASNNLVASDDDSSTLEGGFGSTGSQDPFLTYTFATSGVYFIQVGRWQDGPGLTTFLGTEEFLLNISLTGQTVTAPARRGSDTIYGGLGDDAVYGMGGVDYLHGDGGVDSLRGGEGNDTLYISRQADFLTGEVYDGGSGIDTLQLGGTYGAAYAYDMRVVTLTSIEALRFNDPGPGFVGVAILYASQIGPGLAANATIQFSGQDDVGETLNIQMNGETVLSLANLTFFDADTTGDGTFITGGALSESMTGSSIRDIISGEAGVDSLYGGAGNDDFYGGFAGDQMWGGTGADRFYGGNADAEIDLVRYDDANHGNLIIRLDLPNLNTGAAAGDQFFEIEGLVGGVGNDSVYGSNQANSLFGGAGQDYVAGAGGNDVLNGGTGNDRLLGGAGLDTLTGGTGIDSFFLNTAILSGDFDRIVDFTAADDTMHLDNAIFTGLATGTLTAAAYRANLTGLAGDTSDRIIYETDTGRLYFDADGTGATARLLFATLAPNLPLTVADFVIY